MMQEGWIRTIFDDRELLARDQRTAKRIGAQGAEMIYGRGVRARYRTEPSKLTGFSAVAKVKGTEWHLGGPGWKVTRCRRNDDGSFDFELTHHGRGVSNMLHLEPLCPRSFGPAFLRCERIRDHEGDCGLRPYETEEAQDA